MPGETARSRPGETARSRAFSTGVKITANHQSVVILQNCDPAVINNGAIVVKTIKYQYDINSFLEIYPPEPTGLVVLYKTVDKKTRCDFYTGKIHYKVGTKVLCPDFDPDPLRQCGGGLHLSPTPQLALSYNNGQVLRCLVHVDDIAIYGPDITKVRCREVLVVEEVGK